VSPQSGEAMRDQVASFDIQVFVQTSRLFAEKRRVISPEVLEGFAKEIVTRVAEVVASRSRPGPAGIDPERVAQFCDLLLEPDQPRVALDFITARRAEGTTLQQVYLEYIGSAARLLGERWESDEMTALEVTLGAGTLYALMRALRASSSVIRPYDHRRTALFATVPGEQHGVGIAVAADLFRDAGWDIDLQFGRDHDQLVRRVTDTQPSIIGLSLSTSERLPELAKVAVAVRLIIPDATIGVAPGGDVHPDEVRRVADVDMIFTDAASAIAALETVAVSGHPVNRSDGGHHASGPVDYRIIQDDRVHPGPTTPHITRSK
jgi:MerR family transcriptional regulator, light-induced transcriptional regulator